MSFKKRTITYAALCILVAVVHTAEAESVSQTVEDGIKTTKTQTDDGEVKETQEPISPGPVVGNTRLKVTEYCETLCPGCRMWFTDLFKPNYEEFMDYIEFTIVPWGFAEIVDGKVQCQHEEEECQGNMYQACAIKLGKSEEDHLKYVTCVMTTDGVEAYTSCGQGLANFAEIETCAKGEDGIKYHKEMGDLTNQLQPPLESIPALYIEGKALTEEEKTFMWNDFVSFMCAKLTSVKPKCCDGKETTTSPMPSQPGSTESPSPGCSPNCSPSSSCSPNCSPSETCTSPGCSPLPGCSPSPECSPSPGSSSSPECSPLPP